MKQNRKTQWIRLGVGLLILALIVSNGYFMHKARNAGYEIQIGRAFPAPVLDENGNEIGRTLGIDFTLSKPLKEKSEINAVIFSLIGADTVEKPAVAEEDPRGGLLIVDRETGIGYQYYLWLDGNSVIFGTGSPEAMVYRENKIAAQLRDLVVRQLMAYEKFEWQ